MGGKHFLIFPVPRPGIEPGTSGMVDQSVTTRPPHHPSLTIETLDYVLSVRLDASSSEGAIAI
ncbi:hypothetical protein DPMN_117009 [Dreissena polymorpha]|uniref:Uncharacterized protein n=1 Tax=Dreissena polymorpha TaxID=45954 RepID=A0A9D4KQW4_DREPO|nr:hypothetical protein DPMN_117009 [Dreissena polymorpha]